MRLFPELQFISIILRSSLEPKHSRVEADPHPLLGHTNWEEFIPLVSYHGIGGLLLYWLKELRLKSSLPRDVSRILHGICKSLSNIGEDHQEIIKKILMGFQESNIEVILLKGAQLGVTDYPHFSLRPMGDIDLLVKRSDQSRVIKLMLDMGFNLYVTSEIVHKFFIRRISKRGDKKTQRPIFIEVHSNLQVPNRLNKSFRIDMDEVWNSSQRRSIAVFPFLQLSPTHNLIYLCSHFSEHLFSRLIWGYDIALLIQRHREEIDWKKLEDLCGRMKIRSPVYHSLSLCQELFHIPVPQKLVDSLSPFWGRRKMGEFLIRENLQYPEKSRASRLKQFLIKTFLVDRWMEALLWFLFPTREWIRTQYSLKSTREIYPYYFLHPILYLIKGLRTAMK